MIYNNVIAREIADFLLEHKCVILQPDEPFTWASGLKSPIYCDNRKTLSHPTVRTLIKNTFADAVRKEYTNCDVIAGVATAGIPHGVLVADVLSKPFVYVRDKPKQHGMENLIEGKLEKGQKVVVIEDLISTGGSSLKVVDALRAADVEVLTLGAIFTYNLEKAVNAFKEAKCEYFTLTDYPTLVAVAFEKKYITDEQKRSLAKWYVNPQAWSDKVAVATNA